MIWLCTGIHLGLFFWVIGHGLRVMNNLFIFFKSKIFGFRVTFVMSDSCESRLSVDYASSALGSLFFTSFMQPVISNCTKKMQLKNNKIWSNNQQEENNVSSFSTFQRGRRPEVQTRRKSGTNSCHPSPFSPREMESLVLFWELI